MPFVYLCRVTRVLPEGASCGAVVIEVYTYSPVTCYHTPMWVRCLEPALTDNNTVSPSSTSVRIRASDGTTRLHLRTTLAAC